MISEPEEWLILGVTESGRPFRPSDWAERLCGALAAFDGDHRLRYSRHARPVSRDGQIGIVVETVLQQINPPAYEFLMSFARENSLTIQPGRYRIRVEEDAAAKA